MSALANTKSKKQRDTEDYLSKIKLKEVFQGLLINVITHQPGDPIGYFHEELTKIKKEMEELNVDIESTTFLTSLRPPSSTLNTNRSVDNGVTTSTKS